MKPEKQRSRIENFFSAKKAEKYKLRRRPLAEKKQELQVIHTKTEVSFLEHQHAPVNQGEAWTVENWHDFIEKKKDK